MSSPYSIKTVRKPKTIDKLSLSSTLNQNELNQSRIVQSKFYPHLCQKLIRESKSRFNLVFAGRRFGKSVFAVNRCLEKALGKQDQKVWYCSPLYKQTKEIAWNLFDYFTPKEFISKKNEAELKITFINGSEISLKGTDNPDSLVGVGLNFAVLDEFPLMAETVWYKIVRPMMIDTQGECLFIGTPRGFNWAYDFMRKAEKDSDFNIFHFKSVDNSAVPTIAGEVAKAKEEATSELDKITFRQEYEATFENVTGRPRFDLEVLTKLYATAREYSQLDALLKVYDQPNILANYVIGVDTSEGLITGDNSAAVILNTLDYSVSAYYSGKIPPDILASYLKVWAEKYNRALVVVESNNHGLVTLNYLRDIYPRLYYRKQFEEVSNKWLTKVGFQTSTKTKPRLIDNLDKALRDGLKVCVREILDELRAYIIEEDGSTNASEGSHDDGVIALALAIQGYLEPGDHKRELPKPRVSTYSVPVDKDEEAALESAYQ